MEQIGRNDPCPCGSGKKYKKCCLEKDQQEKNLRIQPVTESNSEIAELESAMAEGPSALESDMDSIFDAFWDEFEGADFAAKVALIEEVYDNPDNLKNFHHFEIFNELNGSAKTKRDRDVFFKLVRVLKEKHFKIYQNLAGYLLDFCLANTFIDQQDPRQLFLEYAGYADKIIAVFNIRIDQLAYHGQLELLAEGFKIGWEKIKKSKEIFPRAIEEYANRGIDLELFAYLQNTPHPSADDEILLNRIAYYLPPDLNYLKEYYASVTRSQAPTWKLKALDVNPKSLDQDALAVYLNNLSSLCDEFLDFLHKEGKKTYTKAELMRTEIRNYLVKRIDGDFKQSDKLYSKNMPNRNLVNFLCPDHSSLDHYLANLIGFMSFRLYRALALYESIPYWLDFLRMNSLIDDFPHQKVYQAISSLYPDLEQLVIKQELKDEFAHQELRAAWNK